MEGQHPGVAEVALPQGRGELLLQIPFGVGVLGEDEQAAGGPGGVSLAEPGALVLADPGQEVPQAGMH